MDNSSAAIRYWIFRCPDTGRCLALPQAALGFIPISDELGELLHDEPMSADMASMYVARYGGTIIGSDVPEFAHAV